MNSNAKVLQRICVLGNAGIETKAFVDMFPQKNCEAIMKRTCINVGGSGAHVASALSALGLKVNLITQVGKDQNGDRVLSELRSLGVDLSYVFVSDSPTTLLYSIFDKNSNRIFFISPTKFDEKTMLQKLSNAFQNSHLMIVCPTTPFISLKAAEVGKDAGKLLVIAPQAAFVEMPQKWIGKFFGLADIIFLNEGELCHYTKITDFQVALKHPLFRDSEIIIVTKGEKGCTVVSGGKVINEQARRVRVVEPSGAGDEFLAGFLWSLIQDHDLRRAARAGCLAGSYVCTEEELFKKVSLLKNLLLNKKW
jgi:sugar/nucleoside kinase (ribokinase family)